MADRTKLEPREQQLVAITQSIVRGDRGSESPGAEPKACTKCKTPTWATYDWTLYPWPDGAWLCSTCNDARFETDDWNTVADAHPDGRI